MKTVLDIWLLFVRERGTVGAFVRTLQAAIVRQRCKVGLLGWLLAFIAVPVADCGSLTLSWNDRSDNEDGFWVERSVDGAHFVEVGESEANEAIFVDETVALGNRYYYRVQAFNVYGTSDYSEVADVLVEDQGTDLHIPDEPESMVIGEMSVLGESVFDVGARSFAVSASGAGYEQYLDELRFTQIEADGDFLLRVQVHAFEADGSWARVGLMVRESLAQNSRHESIVLDGDGYIERLSRLGEGMKVSVSRQAFASGSVFLGIERRNGIVYLSYSHDGENWNTVSGSANELRGRVHVGIAIGSERDGRLSTSLVEVVDSDLRAFNHCSTKWPYLWGRPIEELIIGELDDVGYYSYDSNTGIHTLEASGVGYEQFDDELRFSKVSVSGDVDFSVKISDLDLDGSWGRAGVMLRSSSEQRASHFSVVVNGAGKFEALIRRTDGSKVVTLRGGSAPEVAYLRLSKTGGLVQAYVSVDGESWSLLAESEVELGDVFDAGLAIGSQYDGRLSHCRFEVLNELEVEAPVDPDVSSPTTFSLLNRVAESSIVGSMSEKGTAVYDDSSGLYLFSASGAGYEAYDDALRYSWVPAVGDFSLRVSLHDYVADDGWSRVGLMIRESLQPDSQHASVVLNGSGSFETLVRPTQGAKVTTSVKGSAGSDPSLRLDRIGSRIKLYVARDAGEWQLLRDLEIPLSSAAMVGLSIGSQRDGDLSSCVVEVQE